MEYFFAEPGDPILDEFDPEMSTPPWAPGGEMRKLVDRYRERAAQQGDGDENVEARVPNLFTLQSRARWSSPPLTRTVSGAAPPARGAALATVWSDVRAAPLGLSVSVSGARVCLTLVF